MMSIGNDLPLALDPELGTKEQIGFWFSNLKLSKGLRANAHGKSFQTILICVLYIYINIFFHLSSKVTLRREKKKRGISSERIGSLAGKMVYWLITWQIIQLANFLFRR